MFKSYCNILRTVCHLALSLKDWKTNMFRHVNSNAYAHRTGSLESYLEDSSGLPFVQNRKVIGIFGFRNVFIDFTHTVCMFFGWRAVWQGTSQLWESFRGTWEKCLENLRKIWVIFCEIPAIFEIIFYSQFVWGEKGPQKDLGSKSKITIQHFEATIFKSARLYMKPVIILIEKFLRCVTESRCIHVRESTEN